jgi:predicted secreted hydrolase
MKRKQRQVRYKPTSFEVGFFFFRVRHIDLKPIVADQEMILSIVYWEGAVDASGQSSSGTVKGSGFVEMTGYAKISGQ